MSPLTVDDDGLHTFAGYCSLHVYIRVCLSVDVHLRRVRLEDVCPGGMQSRTEM